MSFVASTPKDRLVGVFGAVLLPGVLLWSLLSGLAVHLSQRVDNPLAVFAVVPAPPPPPRARERTVPHPVDSHKREGAASPPNLRAQRTEVVAPTPVLPVEPPPLVTATIAGTGSADHAGASTVAGPGSGSGGTGNGTGSGSQGDGDGDGGDDIAPQWRKGRLKSSDYPRRGAEADINRTVFVRFAVEIDGRVTHCVVTRSSGDLELDGTTCRLIEQRFRYDPSRDARGRPVRSLVEESHSWSSDGVAADRDD